MGAATTKVTARLQPARDTARADVLAICGLKNQSWPHPMESQLAWWERNTAEDDLFVTLMGGESILAFLRLRSRIVTVDGEKLDVLCATEVCVDTAHQGRGLGRSLMAEAAAHVARTGSGVGYLLCLDAQEPFYAACGWRRTDMPLQIESPSTGERRSLAPNERCMTYDPNNRLNGKIVLFGDVF